MPLFSDQHQADVLGCAGHPDVRTPNLDRLAAHGVRFGDAYCQQGLCLPSRTSLFTGQYVSTLGTFSNATEVGRAHRFTPLNHFLGALRHPFRQPRRTLRRSLPGRAAAPESGAVR